MNRGFWKGLFIFCILMLVMLAGSAPFIEPGTHTYVILQLALIHVLAAMALIAGLLYVEWDPFRAFRPDDEK